MSESEEFIEDSEVGYSFDPPDESFGPDVGSLDAAEESFVPEDFDDGMDAGFEEDAGFGFDVEGFGGEVMEVGGGVMGAFNQLLSVGTMLTELSLKAGFSASRAGVKKLAAWVEERGRKKSEERMK